MTNPTMFNMVIQSVSSYSWSAMSNGSGGVSHVDLYCDTHGNRGCMLGPYWGILFSKEGSTIAISKLAVYEYDPAKWAFVDPFTKEISTILIGLDAISGRHKEFSNPLAQVTVVEDVHTFLQNNVISELKPMSIDNHLQDVNFVNQAIRQLTKNFESSLYKQIPNPGDYSD